MVAKRRILDSLFADSTFAASNAASSSQSQSPARASGEDCNGTDDLLKRAKIRRAMGLDHVGGLGPPELSPEAIANGLSDSALVEFT